MRIFAVSDLHVDFSANYQWLKNISAYDFTDDILILAGDITHERALLKETFAILTKRFRRVSFVPGNHDLWVLRQPGRNSLEAFLEIMKIAADCNISSEPLKYGPVSIIPLLSWYDYSFGQPSQPLLNTWVDFNACKWPVGFGNKEITDYFIAKNDQYLNIKNDRIITFSHFLPRIDLMPRFIPPKVKKLFPVLGSRNLEAQLRVLMPNIHIYGHSHLNRDITLNNIRYINNAFGYPYENRICRREFSCIDNII